MIHFKIKENGSDKPVETTLQAGDKIRIERNFREKTASIQFFRKKILLICDQKQLMAYKKDFERTATHDELLEEARNFRQKVMSFSNIKIDRRPYSGRLYFDYLITYTIKSV